MSQIADFCQSLKQDFSPRCQNPRQPVRCWSEQDILNHKVVDAYVIILRTRGCSWALSSGCTMCGYFNDSNWAPVTQQDFQAQFEHALAGYKAEKIIKVFTSGSFLDPTEIPVHLQQEFLGQLAQRAEKVSVESRPEYVTEKALSMIQHTVQSTLFEVGIGLETSNDLIRDKAINKGFSFKAYVKAAQLLKKHQMNLKTYVLMKPPFLTEHEALDDCLQTTKDIAPYTDLISLNPTNVQRHTVVEYLWKRDQYRPAWLWSVVEYLKQSQTLTDAEVKCDVVGGGSRRGAHNCGTCDAKILQAIQQFSLTQHKKSLKGLTCGCQETWRDQLDLEHLSIGSCVDFQRWRP
ncbi:MAG: archaeosine biosynthesis radical SAM protein RaSEA [Candidatus Thermoplasmatota archaeon]|nr:archaeosine biosynthesis radical SAM protein RaSEA [Candidatus Thermoplasmatota archaeon]